MFLNASPVMMICALCMSGNSCLTPFTVRKRKKIRLTWKKNQAEGDEIFRWRQGSEEHGVKEEILMAVSLH